MAGPLEQLGQASPDRSALVGRIGGHWASGASRDDPRVAVLCLSGPGHRGGGGGGVCVSWGMSTVLMMLTVTLPVARCRRRSGLLRRPEFRVAGRDRQVAALEGLVRPGQLVGVLPGITW